MMPSEPRCRPALSVRHRPGIWREHLSSGFPPDHWVVVDSCKPGERAAALGSRLAATAGNVAARS